MRVFQHLNTSSCTPAIVEMLNLIVIEGSLFHQLGWPLDCPALFRGLDVLSHPSSYAKFKTLFGEINTF